MFGKTLGGVCLKKAILIGATSAVAIAGSIGAYLAFDKSPKEMYFQAELTQLEKTTNQFKDDFEKEFNFYRSISEKSYETIENFALSVESEELKKTNPELLKFLNNVNMNTSIQQDIKEDKMSVVFDLVNKNEYIVGLDATLSPKQIAVKIPSIFENYLYLNTSDYGKFMKNQDETYEGQESLEFSPASSSDFPFDKELGEDIKKEYGKFIFKEISDDSVKLKEVDYNGNKAKSLTLTINENEFKSISKNVLTKLQADEDLINRLSQSLEDYYNSSNGLDSLIHGDDTEEFDTKFFKESLVDSITTSLEKLENDETVAENVVLSSTITVLDNEIVDRKLSLTNSSLDTVILTHKKDQLGGGNIELVEKSNSEKGESTPIFSDTYTFERQKDGFITVHNFNFGATEENTLKLDMTRLVDNDYVTTDITVVDEESFTFTSNSEYTMNEKVVGGTSKLGLDIVDSANILLTSASDVNFTDKLEFPSVGEKDDVDLASITEDEKTELINEMQAKALSVYLKFAGMLMPTSSIEE